MLLNGIITYLSTPLRRKKNIQFHVFGCNEKRAANKKGIACRFSGSFVIENETILEYVAEDSYVIDLADKIDKNELLTMIRNSFSKVKEKFDLRKFGTVLQNKSLSALDETKIDLGAILPLLE